MEGRLPADSIPIFNEAIALVLNRWDSLRMAVEHELGGRESRQKAETLGSDILFRFTQCREPLYIDDLEQMLYDGMLSLNLEMQDGSVEEVAEKLMILHEECLEGNFKSIEKLREANLNQSARPRAMQETVKSTSQEGSQGKEIVMTHLSKIHVLKAQARKAELKDQISKLQAELAEMYSKEKETEECDIKPLSLQQQKKKGVSDT